MLAERDFHSTLVVTSAATRLPRLACANIARSVDDRRLRIARRRPVSWALEPPKSGALDWPAYAKATGFALPIGALRAGSHEKS